MVNLKIKQQSIFLARDKQGLFSTENDLSLAGSKMKFGFSLADSEGLTLIEVMIAMVVFGVGLLALASMQISAITGNSHASHISIATNFIGAKLDAYEAMDYANVVSEANGVNGNFTWTTNVVTNSPLNNLKTVTVTVFWDSHSVSFGTIIAE